MRTAFLVFLLACTGSLFSARADVIFSGFVGFHGNSQSTGSSCGQQGVGVGSISLSCSQQNSSYARVSGDGNAFGGSLLMDLYAAGYQDDPSSMNWAEGSAELQLDEVYVLSGGTGIAVINFNLGQSLSGFPGPDPDVTCSLSFDSVEQQSCGQSYEDWVYPETVQYNVPFWIDFQLTLNGDTPGLEDGAGVLGEYDYSFDASGLRTVPTPEPSSILLAIAGLPGMIACARHRRKLE